VESTGQYRSDDLFLDSVKLLKAKAERFKRHLDALEEGREGDVRLCLERESF
jgi:DNA-directed RNA polymerase I and III subunit RPAC1